MAAPTTKPLDPLSVLRQVVTKIELGEAQWTLRDISNFIRAECDRQEYTAKKTDKFGKTEIVNRSGCLVGWVQDLPNMRYSLVFVGNGNPVLGAPTTALVGNRSGRTKVMQFLTAECMGIANRHLEHREGEHYA